MNRTTILLGALCGGLVTAALTALLYVASELAGTPFVPYDVFDWQTRVLPGDLITFGIDIMIDLMLLLGMSVADTAKTAEQIIALLQFLGFGVVGGAVFFAVVDRWLQSRAIVAGLAIGALAFIPLTPISVAMEASTASTWIAGVWLLLAFAASGAAVGWAYRQLVPVVEAAPDVEEGPKLAGPMSRRQFLVRLGAVTATITVVGSGVGQVLDRAARRRVEEELAASMPGMPKTAPAPFPNAGDPLVPAPGTRPEYTGVKDHYKVFIRIEPTVIEGDTWSLPITGLVDNPMTLKLDDFIANYEPQEEFVTLSCISGRLGTDLIGTVKWTGVGLQDLLADLQVQPNAKYLHITSGDGFYETVDLSLIASDPRIMLAYAWDGRPIPVDHGFPLRIWLPDRYGMKQPKWITAIDVIEEYKEGYWVERGWSEVARVNAVSVVDTVASDHVFEQDGRMMLPVGGIAFAGARGISKVEISVNGGEWEEAKLRAPLSATTWVIWRYDWPFEEGKHTFAVRCNELDGTPQITEFRGPRPSGATGIHSERG